VAHETIKKADLCSEHSGTFKNTPPSPWFTRANRLQ